MLETFLVYVWFAVLGFMVGQTVGMIITMIVSSIDWKNLPPYDEQDRLVFLIEYHNSKFGKLD